MCNLGESILKEGFEQGLEQGLEQGEIKATIELTKKLMKTTNVSIEKAMDMLELPQEIRPTVIEKIKNQE